MSAQAVGVPTPDGVRLGRYLPLSPFDAITSARAYRKPRTHSQALEALQREAGTQLDAEAVEAFVTYYASRRSIGLVAVLAAAPARLLSGLGGVQSGVASGVAPLAQTACGVGGVALLGACLSVSQPTTSTTTRVDREGGARQLAAAATQPAASAPAGATSGRAPAGGRERAAPRQRLIVERPSEPPAPRLLENPVSAPPSADSGGPSARPGGTDSTDGVGDTGITVPPTTPEPPALPAVPDVQGVVDSVTDRVLPQVQVPQLGPLP